MKGTTPLLLTVLLVPSLFPAGCGSPAETNEYYSNPTRVYDADAFTIMLPEGWEGRNIRVWTFAPPSMEDAAVRGRARVQVDFVAFSDDPATEEELPDPEYFHEFVLDRVMEFDEHIDEVDQRAEGRPNGLQESEMRVVMNGDERDEVFFFRHILVEGGFWAVAGICDADAWPGLAQELREIVRSFTPKDPTKPPYAYMRS